MTAPPIDRSPSTRTHTIIFRRNQTKKNPRPIGRQLGNSGHCPTYERFYFQYPTSHRHFCVYPQILNCYQISMVPIICFPSIRLCDLFIDFVNPPRCLFFFRLIRRRCWKRQQCFFSRLEYIRVLHPITRNGVYHVGGMRGTIPIEEKRKMPALEGFSCGRKKKEKRLAVPQQK